MLKKQVWFWSVLVVLSIAMAPMASVAADEEGFKPLFNGENLEGWTIQGLEKAGPKVKDGVLVVDGWDYWAVITKEQYQDFVLRFDVKFDPKGNSGILLHTDPKSVFKNAPEIQLAADDSEEVDKNTSGAIFDKSGLKKLPAKKATKEIGEWNEVEIKVEDGKIWVTINGEMVQDGVDLSEMELIHKNEKGHIAIQRNDYKKAAYFKNIRIKELS